MNPLLTATGFEVRYGQNLAVRGVDISVGQGGITTVIGPNGAGKTSLLAGLVGLERRRGSILFDGRDASRTTPEDNARQGLILVPETRDLFGSMSVEDNLLLGGALGGSRPRPAIREGIEGVFARFPRLGERRRQLAGTLSGGERQMLALGRALVGRPRLLLLDEPSLGLAPRIVAEVFEWIVRLREDGMSILLVEQNARLALSVAQFAYVMEGGRFSASDTPAGLSGTDLAARYFGRAVKRPEAFA